MTDFEQRFRKAADQLAGEIRKPNGPVIEDLLSLAEEDLGPELPIYVFYSRVVRLLESEGFSLEGDDRGQELQSAILGRIGPWLSQGHTPTEIGELQRLLESRCAA